MEKLSKVEKEKDIEEFEREKKQTEQNVYREKMDFLTKKYSEILEKEPVIVYTQHDNYKPEKTREFNNIRDMKTDTTGTGGRITAYFDYDDYISVDKDSFSPSNYFQSGSGYYKMTKDSFNNILNMMDELIKDSGYTEAEKNKMFQSVVDGLKNKIIDEKSLEQVEK
jgi:hypothetical protein